jgi:Family of unknown function (DUF5681)
MGYKNPPREAQFKPGQSGNDKGRPPVAIELKYGKFFTVDELKRHITNHFRMPYDQLLIRMQDHSLPAIEHILMSTIASAIEKGDISKAEYMFMRILGRITEKLEISHPEPVAIHRANGDIIDLDVKKVDEE